MIIISTTILTHLTFLGILRYLYHLRSHSLLYQDPPAYDADPDLCSTGKDGFFIRVFATFILTYYFAILFARIFLCTPISTYWNPGNGTCIDYYVVFTIDAFMSLITDGAILVLPIILAWPLHLPMSKKIRVVAILGAGGLTIVTNIYRLCLMFNEGTSDDQTRFWVKLLYTGYVHHLFTKSLRIYLIEYIC